MSGWTSRQPPLTGQRLHYPTWEFQSDDPTKIIDELAAFFESELQKGVAIRLAELERCAIAAGLNIAKLARSAPNLQTTPDHRGRHLDICREHLKWDADTDDKKAFQELARALLQVSGFLDVTVTLDKRPGGTMTGIGFIDEVLKWETFRGLSNSTIRWGNTHASVLYGPLRFESGVKTSSSTDISADAHANKNHFGILVTSLYDNSPTPRALRLGRDRTGRIVLHTTFLPDPCLDTSAIRKTTPLANIKRVIDAQFVDNGSDQSASVILSAFVIGTLQSVRAQASRRPQVQSDAARHIIDDWFHDESASHEQLIKSQMKHFVDMIRDDPETTDWNAFTNNCQHFCRKVLELDCFRRSYGRDKYPADYKGQPDRAIGLPSISKVLPMTDDRNRDISPFFAKYFNGVELDSMADFGKGMVAKIRTQDHSQAADPPTYLLDLTEYDIPTLPRRSQFSATNRRLGVEPGDARDAWFALSTITLSFLWPSSADPKRQARLALGYYQWLLEVMTPRLMNSILANAFKKLSVDELTIIRSHDEAGFKKRVAALDRKSDKAMELNACWDYEVSMRERGLRGIANRLDWAARFDH